MSLESCIRMCGGEGVESDQFPPCITQCFEDADWSEPENNIPVWAAILSSSFLVLLSGLFSGLTLGLLSLDLVGLRILEQGGDPEEKIHAARIMPVRKKGNLLLCTLLLGNTATNSAISILLSGVSSGVVGLIVSTFVIMILGEIIPQALCNKHSLKLGALSIPVVKFFTFLFFPITWPISYILDKALGRDIGTVYSPEELKRLIELHVEDPDAQKESGLTTSDQRLLTGILEYKAKRVGDVMTKIENAFMLEKSMKLNFQTLSKIYISGCSRIPIYEGDRQNIVGILFVKDLVLVDPDDEMEISTVMSFRGRTAGRMYDNCTLDKCFTRFIATANHMLIAHAPPDGQQDFDGPIEQTPVTGLITLEDVLEEMIKSEIYDESDIGEDARRSKTHRHDVSIYLNLFEHKLRGLKLSPQELQAVYAFLAVNLEEFRQLSSSDVAFKGLVRTAEVLEKAHDAADDREELWTGPKFWEKNAASGNFLYEHGRQSSYFTLILQGKVVIRTASEGFELDLGPWSHLGNKALVSDHYAPDFDAVAIPPYRLLRVHRGSYLAALDALRLEQAREYQAVKQQMRARADTLPSTGKIVDAPSVLSMPSLSLPSLPHLAGMFNNNYNQMMQNASMQGMQGLQTMMPPMLQAQLAQSMRQTEQRVEINELHPSSERDPLNGGVVLDMGGMGEGTKNTKGFNPQVLDVFSDRHFMPSITNSASRNALLSSLISSAIDSAPQQQDGAALELMGRPLPPVTVTELPQEQPAMHINHPAANRAQHSGSGAGGASLDASTMDRSASLRHSLLTVYPDGRVDGSRPLSPRDNAATGKVSDPGEMLASLDEPFMPEVTLNDSQGRRAAEGLFGRPQTSPQQQFGFGQGNAESIQFPVFGSPTRDPPTSSAWPQRTAPTSPFESERLFDELAQTDMRQRQQAASIRAGVGSPPDRDANRGVSNNTSSGSAGKLSNRGSVELTHQDVDEEQRRLEDYGVAPLMTQGGMARSQQRKKTDHYPDFDTIDK